MSGFAAAAADKISTAQMSQTVSRVRMISLTCCLDVVVGSVLASGSEASPSNRSMCCFLWSGDGVSSGRLRGGPGLCTTRRVKSKPYHTHTHARMQTQWGRHINTRTMVYVRQSDEEVFLKHTEALHQFRLVLLIETDLFSVYLCALWSCCAKESPI